MMNILFVKIGAIGDAVQAGAAMLHFRNINPDVRVDWLAGSAISNLVYSLGVADNVFELNDHLLYNSHPAKYLHLGLNFIRQIKSPITYDVIATAHHDWRYRLLTFGIRCRTRRAFQSNGRKRCLIISRSRVYEYFCLLNGGVDVGTNFDIARSTHRLGENYFLKVNANGLTKNNYEKMKSNNYCVVIPGGAKNNLRDDNLRRWPITYYKELTSRLSRLGLTVVLAGSKSDEWVKDYFIDNDCIDYVGKTSLGELVELLNFARVVVTHDTGPLHLASITQVPIVALFGPTSANAVIPFGREKTITLQVGNVIPCSPCYDGRDYSICSHQRCMKEISPDMVEKAVIKLIRST